MILALLLLVFADLLDLTDPDTATLAWFGLGVIVFILVFAFALQIKYGKKSKKGG